MGFDAESNAGQRAFDAVETLIAGCASIETTRDYQTWIKDHLRAVLPHGMFVATVGRGSSVGSVPTHFITEGFPLTYTEAIKNSDGSIESPVMKRWFATGAMQVFELGRTYWAEITSHWLENFIAHEVVNVVAHGQCDTACKRFAYINVGQIPGRLRPWHISLVEALTPALCAAAWRVVDARPRAQQPAWPGLTDKEIDIVGLAAQGLSNKEIGRLRGIAETTVRTHLDRAAVKLGAKRRSELVAVALPLLRVFPPASGFESVGAH